MMYGLPPLSYHDISYMAYYPLEVAYFLPTAFPILIRRPRFPLIRTASMCQCMCGNYLAIPVIIIQPPHVNECYSPKMLKTLRALIHIACPKSQIFVIIIIINCTIGI